MQNRNVIPTETHHQPILKASQLVIGYYGKALCRSIDFSLAQGELAAIVGVNGIGKSTLLRTLGKVHPKISGTIAIHGRASTAFTPKELASVLSLVLTEVPASRNLSVYELVALGRQPYTDWLGRLDRQDRDRVAQVLARLGLEALRDRKCHELSDGQLQRVLIARALAQETDLILLDEPTTHLDLYHKAQILKLLKDIAQEDEKTVLFATHEIGLAIQLCDKMLILGTKEHQFGQPCELIERMAFDRLFPSDTVVFDHQTGTFQIQ